MNGASAENAGGGEPLDELLTLGESLAPTPTVSALRDARERTASRVFNIAVLGEFKRGKSTLVNALLGRPLLPTGVVPLTSGVTIVRPAGSDGITVRFADGSAEAAGLEALADYVTEARNPGNRRGVESVIVEARDTRLGGGIRLIDTPGIASVHEHNSAATLAFLPRVDAALCVLAADQPLTSRERDFLIEAAGFAPRLMLALNRIDTLTADELDEALEFLTARLGEAFANEAAEVFPISALVGSGVDLLRERLTKSSVHEVEPILQESLRRAGRRLADEAALAARLEIAALRLPLEDLEQRTSLFEDKLQELLTAQAQAEDSLDHGLRRIIASEIDEPLAALASECADPLCEDLRTFAASILVPRRVVFARSLDAWVDGRVKDEFDALVPRFEHAVDSALADLERTHAERIAAILAALHVAAGELFDADPLGAMPERGLRAPSRFSFKLRDVRHALDQLVTLSRRAVPGPPGRRLLVRDAEARLARMLDRHAGRLRSELAARGRDAAREYERDLASVVSDAADAIRGTLQRAAEERVRGEDAVRVRMDELDRTVERCTELGETVGGGHEHDLRAREVS